MKLKRKAYNLAVMSRHLRLTSLEQTLSKRYMTMIIALKSKLESEELEEEERNQIINYINILMKRYLFIVVEPENIPKQYCTNRKYSTIDSFTEAECTAYFRFSRIHLKKTC